MEFYRGFVRGNVPVPVFWTSEGILPEAPWSVKGRVAEAEIEMRPAPQLHEQ